MSALLHLLKGQARFDVAHDKSRPFSVVAGNQRVIATGTAFNIDMAGPKVFVTLIEGHVVVVNEDNDGRWELRAGQELTASTVAAAPDRGRQHRQGHGLDHRPDRVRRRTAVLGGGARQPLQQHPILIADPAVAQMRISGVFNAGDAPGFVEIVTHYLPVKAVPQADGTIALQSENRKSWKQL